MNVLFTMDGTNRNPSAFLLPQSETSINRNAGLVHRGKKSCVARVRALSILPGGLSNGGHAHTFVYTRTPTKIVFPFFSQHLFVYSPSLRLCSVYVRRKETRRRISQVYDKAQHVQDTDEGKPRANSHRRSGRVG